MTARASRPAACWIAAALLIAPRARADAAATNLPPLTLAQVVADVVEQNAELRAAHWRTEAMAARPAVADALPNPMLQVQGMDAVSGGSFPDTAEKRYEVEQTFPWFGKRGLRERVAVKDAEAAANAVDALRRDLVFEAQEAYFSLYATRQAQAILAAERALLQRLQTVAETRYANGAVPQSDVLKAQAEVTMQQQRVLELAQQARTLEVRLNALRNQPPDAPLGPLATAPAEAEAVSAVAPSTDAAPRAEVRSAQAAVARDRLARELMHKEFWPDYRLGFEYRSIADGDDLAMVTVGLELPVWQGRNRAGLREAQRALAASEADLDAARRQAEQDVQDAQFRAQTARQTVALYRDTLIPQAESRFAASEAGYGSGAVDFNDLLESERFWLNARVLLATAEGQQGTEQARLARAIGAPPSKEEQVP